MERPPLSYRQFQQTKQWQLRTEIAKLTATNFRDETFRRWPASHDREHKILKCERWISICITQRPKEDNSPNIFVFADKTRNIYETTTETYNKFLNENVTRCYKVDHNETMKDINTELKSMVSSLSTGNKIEPMPKREAFVSLKDPKENFQNNPKCWPLIQLKVN